MQFCHFLFFYFTSLESCLSCHVSSPHWYHCRPSSQQLSPLRSHLGAEHGTSSVQASLHPCKGFAGVTYREVSCTEWLVFFKSFSCT